MTYSLHLALVVYGLSLFFSQSLFFTHFPAYMKNMFSLLSSSYDLRGNYILSLSRPKTTTYGLNSSVECTAGLFFVPVFFADFKTKIQDVTFM